MINVYRTAACRALLCAWVAIAGAHTCAAEGNGEIDGVVRPGSSGNEFSITVKNPHTNSAESIALKVVNEPKWISNIRIAADGSGALAPDASRTFTMKFDVRGYAEEGATDSVKFELSARGALVEDPNPGMTVRIAKTVVKPGVVRVHPLRQGSERKFMDDDSYLLCDYDEKRVFNVEPVWLFLKPGRLVEVERAQDGLRFWHGNKPAGWTGRKPTPGGPEPEGDWEVRILGPEGEPRLETGYRHRYQWKGDGVQAQQVEHIAFRLNPATGEVPAPLAILLQANRLERPGQYTVQTRSSRLGAVDDDADDDPPPSSAAGRGSHGESTLGQPAGSTAPPDPRRKEVPWHTEGTFDILDSRLHFQGFVAEKSVPIKDDFWTGDLKLQTQTAESTVTMTADGRFILKQWADKPTSQRPEDAEKRALSRLTLALPPVLKPGLRGGGWGIARHDVVEKGARREFSPKVMGFVASAGPPHRSLSVYESEDGPKMHPDSVHIFQTTESWEPGVVPEHAWGQIRVGGYEPPKNRGDVRIVYALQKHPWATRGKPERTLQWHLRDPKTRVYLLVDFHLYTWNIYGFGVYGLSSEPYDGPSPAAPPGTEPGDEPGTGRDGDIADATDSDRPPGSDDMVDADDGDRPGEDVTQVDPLVPGQDRPPGSQVVPPGGGGETTRTEPVNPDRLNPRDPDVAALIREWISIARPPQNAVPGANCRYDPYGRIVGTMIGVRTIRTHDSVDYRAGTPEETVWGLRKKLDSVDHGTLEEYVVARLEGRSISPFTGRYRGIRDLKGVRLVEAKVAVTGAGLTFTLAPGTPAETPEDEGTIEQQEPAWRQYLRKGQTLKLTVHSPYVPDLRTLPDFVGMPLAESRKWLEKNKLKPRLRPGSAAPAREKSGTVEAQDPAEGTVMQAGGEVALTIHAPYVPTVPVPNLADLSFADARKRLLDAGLTLQPALVGPAPEESKASTVAGQKPPATTEVAAGSSVLVEFYGAYAPPGVTVPNLQDKTLAEAKRLLDRAGIGIDPTLLGAAPDQSLSQKIRSQHPAAGMALPPGSTVKVDVWSDYIEPGVGVPNVTTMTLADAKKALRDVGLDIKPTLLGPAPSEEKAERVDSQKPLPGGTVPPGTTVEVLMYTKAPAATGGSSPGGVICFQAPDPRRSGAAYSLWVINADGSGLRRIVDDGVNPRLSRDRKQLVYIRYLNDRKPVWICNIDGSGQRQLTRDPDIGFYGPSWAPRNDRILFTRNAPPYPSCSLAWVRPNGHVQILERFDSYRRGSYALSPDGRSMVFCKQVKWPYSAVCVRGLGRGSAVRQLTSPSQAEPRQGDLSPSWSPNGKTIAFFRSTIYRNRYTYDLCLIPAGGGAMRNSVADANGGGSITTTLEWSPDSRELLFLQNKPRLRLALVDVASGSVRPFITKAKKEIKTMHADWK